MAVREARLRPEWAHLYPGLEANVWVVAAQLVPLVLRHRLQDQPTWEFIRRILVDDHFLEPVGGHKRDNSWSGVLSGSRTGRRRATRVGLCPTTPFMALSPFLIRTALADAEG